MSPLIPARCRSCGHQWQPEGGILIVGDASNVQMSGNTLSGSCPECGGTADLLEGRFDVIDGAIDLKSGPGWSWDLVANLRLQLERIVKEGPADPVAALAEVDPALGADVDRVTRGWSRADKLALLALVLTVLYGDYSNVRSVAAAVRALLQHVADHGLPGT